MVLNQVFRHLLCASSNFSTSVVATTQSNYLSSDLISNKVFFLTTSAIIHVYKYTYTLFKAILCCFDFEKEAYWKKLMAILGQN